MKCNKKFTINFDGGELSSDGGLLIIKEFLHRKVDYYCNRGRMENFIGESKQGFDFAAASSRSKTVNANRLQLHALAYNIFNWFRRLALPSLPFFRIFVSLFHTNPGEGYNSGMGLWCHE